MKEVKETKNVYLTQQIERKQLAALYLSTYYAPICVCVCVYVRACASICCRSLFLCFTLRWFVCRGLSWRKIYIYIKQNQHRNPFRVVVMNNLIWHVSVANLSQFVIEFINFKFNSSIVGTHNRSNRANRTPSVICDRKKLSQRLSVNETRIVFEKLSLKENIERKIHTLSR